LLAAAQAAVAAQASKLKDAMSSADRLFLQKDYAKAADVYEQAAKVAPASEKAELMQKRAGCFMSLQRCAADVGRLWPRDGT
jgi:hypothetical protein